MGEAVSFETVLKAFREHQRPEGDAADRWALHRLEEADRCFGGWVKKHLTAEEARGVLLVYHKHGDGEPLVPREGATVEEAVDRVRALEDFEEGHRSCHERISRFRESPFSPVFLASGPLENSSAEQYDWLQYREGHLVHLDGLHRLLAWTLDGRFGEGYDGGLDVFVAVDG